MRYLPTVASAFVLAVTPCLAHQDAIIQIKTDGSLVGLPKEFSPSSIHIEFSKSKSRDQIAVLQLSLNGKSITIPAQILNLLKSNSLDCIQISASWYHEERYLPYYMRVEFLEPGFDRARPDNPGIAMLFNLRTGKLMSLSEIVITDPGRSWEERTINLSKLCSPTELSTFYEPLKYPKPQ